MSDTRKRTADEKNVGWQRGGAIDKSSNFVSHIHNMNIFYKTT